MTQAQDELAKHKKHMARTKLENDFAWQLKGRDIKGWKREHKFHPTRKWRFDFAWPALMVAVEVDGGAYSGGRHTRGSGYEKDCEKLNAAAVLGWTVLRGTGGMIKDCSLVTALEELRARLRESNGKPAPGAASPGQRDKEPGGLSSNGSAAVPPSDRPT